MYPPNVEAVLARLTPTDQVLDVGGWACPFNRAQWVLDSEPFETRGFYKTVGLPASQGGAAEWFSGSTWVQRDICDREPWPFRDKHFDFVVCSHTLEDLRDPIWVCSELQRVGKRGYIEVPSRAFESSRGVERPGQAGLSHHRWLIDIRGQEIVFLQKLHMIHAHWRFALPSGFGKALTPAESVQWLWWTDRFRAREKVIHGLEAMERDLEDYVAAVHPYSPVRLKASKQLRRLASFGRRVAAKLSRELSARTGAH